MFLIERVLGSKNLFSESCLKWPHYYREVISDFWFGGSNTRLPSPEGGRQTKSCSDQKTYFAKVVRSGYITMEKWSRIFDLGGPRLVFLPPKGEGKWKVVGSKNLFCESWSERPYYFRDLVFLIWGVQDLIAFPRRGKANKKLLGWKNLFSKSWSEHPSYYR